jgi:dephospho-CoA kinase
MLRVGLTGGIGSGKSRAAERFAMNGAAIVDTDVIARELTGPGGEAMDAIRRAFGARFVDGNGALDRAAMRSLVFERPEQRRGLEAILHPLIRERAIERAARAIEASPYVIIAVPLLVEGGGWRGSIDRVLVVDVPVRTQIDRVARTRGLARTEVTRIVSQQAPRRLRIAAADDVLYNDGPPEALEVRVDRLHAFYLDTARSCGSDLTAPRFAL